MDEKTAYLEMMKWFDRNNYGSEEEYWAAVTEAVHKKFPNVSGGKKAGGATSSGGKPCTDATAADGAVALAKAHRGRSLRVLVLPGGGMGAEEMRQMMSNLDFAPLVDFVYVQAPHADGGPLWMGDAEKQGPHSVTWWDDSVSYLRGVIAEQGPFDGIFGYSMGCATAFSFLALVPDGTFRFAILCCGYVPTNHPNIVTSLEAARPLRVPTLHVQGQNDTLMTTTGLADAMIPYFDPGAVELCVHPGDHSHPYNTEHVNQLAHFMLRFAPTE